ncbi:DUF1501 domain-containing protein [Fulvivirga sp. M361]|uniref:DUF1501 domain-containing protein n=1 Tax=Fulvivirga sp. M361 TaxID=2594266 RepID=UPI00117A4A31|nr:DUF1501 domain-containing protein [Fulvivirga sp. M361]TRX49343.1 DUF1501 domain-containing protein [Fulvivirga sp. M361]
MLDLDKNSRRSFLKQSSLITVGTLLAPNFLHACANQERVAFNGKRLIVIQLSGGNDGLNTVIPYRNDLYYQLRPGLSYQESDALKLNDEIALNPGMNGLRELFDHGDVCIMNNVGYPNPNRSHFRSMDIWHTGSSSNKNWDTGWLGRYLDQKCNNTTPYQAIEMDDSVSLALRGDMNKGFSVSKPAAMYNSVKHIEIGKHEKKDNENLNYLYKTLADTKQFARYVYEKSKIYKSAVNYPNSKFGSEMKRMAELIMSGVESQVFYISLTGFDTHARQKNKQQKLLMQYSDALSSLTQDLKQNNQWDNTLIFTFSEFGRRVKQNASGGTDHGTANNVFITGGKLKQTGIMNETADLANLDKGDLIHSVDFRSVYATLLDKWLDCDADKILKQSFGRLNFI